MTATDTAFSLRSLVRSVLDESAATDPVSLAEIVLDQIADDDLRAALAETLPGYVRVQINRDNMNARAAVPRDLHENAGPGGKAARSWKVGGIREHGRAFRDVVLGQRLFVKSTDGAKRWRLYGDFDPDDLRNLMADRAGDAQEILSEVERHRRVLKQCEDFGGVRVRDLPDEVLLKAWDGEQ